MAVRSLPESLALILSGIGSPYLVCTGTALLVLLASPGTRPEKIEWAAASVLLPVVLPFVFTWAMVRRGRMTDLHVGIRQHRTAVFAVAIVGAVLGCWLLWRLQAPPLVLGLGVSYVVNGLVFALISQRWKISMHTAVLAASGGVLYKLTGWSAAIVMSIFLLAVVWARVYRGRHTWPQALCAIPIALAVTKAIFLLLRV